MKLNLCNIIQQWIKRFKHMNVDSEQITLDKFNIDLIEKTKFILDIL